MPLGIEVGFGPGDIVLGGDPAPARKTAQQPASLFGPYLLWPNGGSSQQLLSSCLNTITSVFVMVSTETAYRQLVHAADTFCENQLKACSLSASISIGGTFSFP